MFWRYRLYIIHNSNQYFSNTVVPVPNFNMYNWNIYRIVGHFWMRKQLHEHAVVKIINTRRNMFIMFFTKRTRSIWFYSIHVQTHPNKRLKFLLWNLTLCTIVGLLRKYVIRHIYLKIYNHNIKNFSFLKHALFILNNSSQTGVRIKQVGIWYKKSFGYMRYKKVARRKRRLQKRIKLKM